MDIVQSLPLVLAHSYLYDRKDQLGLKACSLLLLLLLLLPSNATTKSPSKRSARSFPVLTSELARSVGSHTAASMALDYISYRYIHSKKRKRMRERR
jgi:hypothetical protein